MITSERAELPSKINVYYVTWDLIGLISHQLLSANLMRAIVRVTPSRPITLES
jgi:hypothetical protein